MNDKAIVTLIILPFLLAACANLNATPTRDMLPTPDPSLVSGYEPQPDDINLERSWLFLNWDFCSLEITEGYPVQVSVYLGGDLPNPCHALRVAVTPANAAGEINLEVYALVNPEINCIEMLDPFHAKIPLGAYTSGHYSVLVNGGLLGEFEP